MKPPIGCRAVLIRAAVALALVRGASAEEPLLLSLPDAFRTLVNPDCSHCVDEAKARAEELRDDDPVLAWTRGKYDGGAIPIRFFLNPFRVISDTYGVFVYDPDAGFARGFEPSLDFSFHGWRGGVMVMRHKDGTLFSTLSGRAFDGPRKGARLRPIPTLTTQWGYWKKAYPGSVAYRMFEKYRPVELPKSENADSKRTRGPVDPRLGENEEVLGVALGDVSKAYPLAALPKSGGVTHDALGGEEIVLLWNPATRTAAAYGAFVESSPPRMVRLAFDPAEPAAPFLDRASGSRFGVEGRAVSGELKGKTLPWIDSVQCRWFAWSSEHPGTLLAAVGAASAPAPPGEPTREIVLVEPASVDRAAIHRWRGQGFTGLAVILDEERSREAYRAARLAADEGIDLYFWVEVARHPATADAHPEWMASLGMHDDWRRRFSNAAPVRDGEVAKAYPWTPIGYAEAFEAHLDRMGKLLAKAPASFRGVLLNDLQGGPSACGCGNLQCRWAIDYGVPSTATASGVDDAAARFIARVRKLAAGKEVVPVWMTECEVVDLPADKSPTGESTGLCGSVACARGACPKAFHRQLKALLRAHSGALGLLVAETCCERPGRHYGGPAGWIPAAVRYLDQFPVSHDGRGVAHDRLWLVVQGSRDGGPAEEAARRLARSLHPRAVVAARTAIDQSFEPRVIPVRRPRSNTPPE